MTQLLGYSMFLYFGSKRLRGYSAINKEGHIMVKGKYFEIIVN